MSTLSVPYIAVLLEGSLHPRAWTVLEAGRGTGPVSPCYCRCALTLVQVLQVLEMLLPPQCFSNSYAGALLPICGLLGVVSWEGRILFSAPLLHLEPAAPNLANSALVQKKDLPQQCRWFAMGV